MSRQRVDRPDPSDPLLACLGLTLGFFLLCLWRLWLPSTPYFDEIHYLPAARELLTGYDYRNPEHPPLGKEIIAAGIAIFGDNPWGWRIFSALAGALALFAGMRALWHAGHRRDAVIAYGVLLATGFQLFVHAQIAMLDVFMVAFFLTALWQLAAACRARSVGSARRALVLSGIALGCAIAAKWNAAPLAPRPPGRRRSPRPSSGRGARVSRRRRAGPPRPRARAMARHRTGAPSRRSASSRCGTA